MMNKLFDRLIELEGDDDRVETLLRKEFGDEEVDNFFRTFNSLPISKPKPKSDVPGKEIVSK